MYKNNNLIILKLNFVKYHTRVCLCGHVKHDRSSEYIQSLQIYRNKCMTVRVDTRMHVVLVSFNTTKIICSLYFNFSTAFLVDMPSFQGREPAHILRMHADIRAREN